MTNGKDAVTKRAEQQKKRVKWPLVLLALVLLLVGGYFASQYLLKDKAVQQEAALKAALEMNTENTMDTFKVTVDPDDLMVTEGLDPDWMNILLLGTDTRKGMLNEGRSDAMLILSVNKKTGHQACQPGARHAGRDPGRFHGG